MTFLEHLNELRKRLLHSLIAFPRAATRWPKVCNFRRPRVCNFQRPLTPCPIHTPGSTTKPPLRPPETSRRKPLSLPSAEPSRRPSPIVRDSAHLVRPDSLGLHVSILRHRLGGGRIVVGNVRYQGCSTDSAKTALKSEERDREGTEGKGAGGFPRGRVCDLPGRVGELGPADRNIDPGAFRPILRVRALGREPPGRRLAVGRWVDSGPDLESED